MNFIDAVKKLKDHSAKRIIRREYNDHPSRAVYMIEAKGFNAYLGLYDDSSFCPNIECVLADDWEAFKPKTLNNLTKTHGDKMNFFEILEHLRKDSNNIAYHETWNKTNPDTKIDTYICCQDGVNLEKFYTYKPSERFSNLYLMMSDKWIKDELMIMPAFSGESIMGKEFKFNIGDFIHFGINDLNKIQYEITEINYKNEYVLISIFARTIFSLSKEYVEKHAILCKSNLKNMNFRDVIRKLKNTTNYRAKHADKIIRYSHWSDQLYICSDQKVDRPVEESFYYPTTEEILSDKWELLMIEEPKLYSFKKAIKHFMDGHSIKRYSWKNFINKDNTDEYEDIFSVKDIQGNDWQINGN